MTDFLNYNALSKDPVAMEEALNKVQVELREERLARHKLEGEMGRIQRHNKHLEYNLKRMKIQFGQSSPTGNTDINRKKVAQTTVHVGLDSAQFEQCRESISYSRKYPSVTKGKRRLAYASRY